MSSIALGRAYQRSFETHPHFTLAIAGGTLTALGDVVAQTSQRLLADEKDRHPHEYDVLRTTRFFLFGAGVSPVIGRWNKFLEARFPLRLINGSGQAGRVSFRALAKRVAADQIIMAPIGLTLFLGSMGIMEGRDRSHIAEKFRQLYWPALKTNWQVWPAAQFMNFRFMPLPYRVPFQQTCGVFWTLYLSILNSKEEARAALDDANARTVNL
ncbi:hypothetical protein PENSPDRAFT_679158 [Peniophora sp. CONT]|nr:hypothetical protein PENSPDRAFT_679158 [Peniophora sp. CONT]